MNHDPLLQHIGIVLQRSILFLILSLAQAVVCWLWFWAHFKQWSLVEATRHLANAWPLSLDAFSSVQAMGMVWIGVANSAILYLALGRWWKRRADVLHRRGSRVVDQREEK